MTELPDRAPVGERLLWSSRLLLLGGVVGSAVLAAAVVWIATVDVVRFAGDVIDYTESSNNIERGELVAVVVKIIDTYLIAAILVVAAFGLYELFIGRIDARRTSDDGPRVLVARSLDELKDRIAKLVILILVIEFFQRAVQVDATEASDLLLLAGGVALVSLALALPVVADAIGGGKEPKQK